MKKKYIAPKAEIVNVLNESLLETASPGVGGDYNPDEPIGAKRGDLYFDYEEEVANDYGPGYNYGEQQWYTHRSLWDE